MINLLLTVILLIKGKGILIQDEYTSMDKLNYTTIFLFSTAAKKFGGQFDFCFDRKNNNRLKTGDPRIYSSYKEFYCEMEQDI